MKKLRLGEEREKERENKSRVVKGGGVKKEKDV